MARKSRIDLTEPQRRVVEFAVFALTDSDKARDLEILGYSLQAAKRALLIIQRARPVAGRAQWAHLGGVSMLSLNQADMAERMYVAWREHEVKFGPPGRSIPAQWQHLTSIERERWRKVADAGLRYLDGQIAERAVELAERSMARWPCSEW